MKYFALILLLLFAVACNTSKKGITIKVVDNKRTIDLGDSVRINWDIAEKRIKNISIVGVRDDLPKQGTIVLQPDTTAIYRFLIEYKNGDTTPKSIKINVKEPQITYFMAPDSVSDETVFQVRWSTSNCVDVLIPGYRKNLPLTGSINMRIDSSATLRLVGVNRFRQYAEKRLPIEVTVIEDFQAPPEIYIGDTVSMHWKFKRAQHVAINGYDTLFNPIDTLWVSPDSSCTYNFTILDNDGLERETSHYMNVLPPTVLYFNGPKSINLGGEATLQWSVRGADNVYLAGISTSMPHSGKIVVRPQKKTTYKLVIERGDFISYKYIDVDVVRHRKYIGGTISEKALASDERIDMEIIGADYSAYPEEIKLRVVAVDSKGNFITGLSPQSKYFKKMTITTGGKSYNMSGFGVKEKTGIIYPPYDIAMALDNSASLEEVIDTLNAAIKTFIGKKTKDDRIGVVKFSDTLGLSVPLNANTDAILSAGQFTKQLYPGGSTALYAGADYGTILLKNAEGRKHLILFTDGRDNASFVFRGKYATSANELLAKAKEHNVRVIVVAYGDEVNSEVLQHLAWNTGGNCYSINAPTDLRNVFEELAFSTKNYYEINYKPLKIDGLRKVELAYNNLQGGTADTEIEFAVGTLPDLASHELQGAPYWTQQIPDDYELVVPPQAAAFFHFDKSNLLDEFKPDLMKFGSYMTENPDVVACIFGHTDLKGSKEYCLALSEKRGEMVKQFLTSTGIDAKRLTVVKCGQNNPIWKAEAGDWQAAENRRIEILLLKKKQK